MRSGSHRYPLTIAVHPTARGFGWVAFEGPSTPYDWGIVSARSDKNTVCLEALKRLFKCLEPETIVLEASKQGSARKERIARLSQAMVSLAEERNIQAVIYARADIEACFAPTGARSRHEIAEAVCRCVNAFDYRLPETRKLWKSEDRRMSLFSAAALALTHYARG